MILGEFLRAVAMLLHLLIQLYILVILVRAVISWVGTIPPNAFTLLLRRLTDPLFRMVHRYLPFTIAGGIDFSPLVIIVGLYIIDHVVVGGLMRMALGMIAGGSP